MRGSYKRKREAVYQKRVIKQQLNSSTSRNTHSSKTDVLDGLFSDNGRKDNVGSKKEDSLTRQLHQQTYMKPLPSTPQLAGLYY